MKSIASVEDGLHTTWWPKSNISEYLHGDQDQNLLIHGHNSESTHIWPHVGKAKMFFSALEPSKHTGFTNMGSKMNILILKSYSHLN